MKRSASSSATTSSSAPAPGRRSACSPSLDRGRPGARRTCSRVTPLTSSSRRSTRGVGTALELVVDGYDFAPTFSIWTTIEECLNLPDLGARIAAGSATAPFSEPELFDFPEGIGPVECVNVEHEEVLLVPRWVDCERVTSGLGGRVHLVLKTLTGSDSTRRNRSGSRSRTSRRATSWPLAPLTRRHSASA